MGFQGVWRRRGSVAIPLRCGIGGSSCSRLCCSDRVDAAELELSLLLSRCC